MTVRILDFSIVDEAVSRLQICAIIITRQHLEPAAKL